MQTEDRQTDLSPRADPLAGAKHEVLEEGSGCRARGREPGHEVGGVGPALRDELERPRKVPLVRERHSVHGHEARVLWLRVYVCGCVGSRTKCGLSHAWFLGDRGSGLRIIAPQSSSVHIFWDIIARLWSFFCIHVSDAELGERKRWRLKLPSIVEARGRAFGDPCSVYVSHTLEKSNPPRLTSWRATDTEATAGARSLNVSNWTAWQYGKVSATLESDPKGRVAALLLSCKPATYESSLSREVL